MIGEGKRRGKNKSLWVPKLVGPEILNNIYYINILYYNTFFLKKGVIYTHLSHLSTLELWKLQAMALHWLVGWL